MSHATMEEPLGIDRARVDAWLASRISDLQGPVEYRLIAGGRSNLTYEVRDATGRRWALRRPPMGRVLPSAHDMAREHRIIAALRRTAVPVPEPIGLCDDPSVSGAPFYVMAFVDGHILKAEDDVVAAFAAPARRTVTRSLIESMAELHRVDPRPVGLGDLGRPDGYAGRQLARWRSQFERAKCREMPAIDETAELLEASIPTQQRTSIVHGDYRIDNCVFDASGEVCAVLDWELCTLGDPLADLGLLLVYWIEQGEQAPFMPNGTPTVLPGFPSRGEIVDHYAATSGLDVSHIDFYTALGYWKLACILEGMHAKAVTGSAPIDEFLRDVAGPQAVTLSETALRIARQRSA
ncbi:phosphotransferase family protein [Patulibacter sp. NPDC049589]|uniref:phosphotransferase family protein n=1 Tax=Patulibacter sp. NPDC049589 TaxID=3154731 RepID=UPI0034284511